MAIVRKDEWRQDNPRDQAKALVMAIEGDIYNMACGVGDPDAQETRIMQRCQDVQRLLDILPPGSW